MAEIITEFFGIDVFNESVMKERLPKATYKALKKTIEEGTALKPDHLCPGINLNRSEQHEFF